MVADLRLGIAQTDSDALRERYESSLSTAARRARDRLSLASLGATSASLRPPGVHGDDSERRHEYERCPESDRGSDQERDQPHQPNSPEQRLPSPRKRRCFGGTATHRRTRSSRFIQNPYVTNRNDAIAANDRLEVHHALFRT